MAMDVAHILHDVLSQHSAFLGKTGSGKTSTAKLAIEQATMLTEDVRVCILDPIKSDWWGITSSADGKRPGLPFHILGGPHGHVALHSSAGTAIGELVGRGALPLSIIDMADFEPGGLQRFFCDFAPALMRSMRGVLHLVIEEAHEFAPKERAGLGQENLAIHYAKKLATAGRSKGIRLMVATQRTQQLHNAVLGSCETIVVHRLTAPADQAPVIGWLKANAPDEMRKAVSDSLARLPTGTGWVCSGETGIFERVAFPRISTFDNSATPKSGDQAQQVTTAKVDLGRLTEVIGEAIAKAEANDPKKLRDKIAALERKLEAFENQEAEDAAAPPITAALKAARDEGWDEGMKLGAAEGTRVARQTLASITRDLQRAQDGIRLALATCEHWAMGAKAEPPAKMTADDYDEAATVFEPHRYHDPDLPAPKNVSVKPIPSRLRHDLGLPPLPGALPGAAKPLLEVLLAQDPVRLTWAQIATLAGLKARGGHYNAGKQHLLKHEIAVEEAGLVGLGPRVNVAGLTARKGAAPKTPTEVLEMWLGKLKAPANQMLRYLVSTRNGSSVRIEEMAHALGMKPRGGHWNGGLSVLRNNGLIQNGPAPLIRASDLFLRKPAQAA